MTSSEKICGLLGLATRAGKTVFGTESCMSAIEKRKVKLILLASDASERTKTNFKEICNKNNIEVSEMLKMESLSKAIGKNNKAILGIEDINLSKEIERINNGGEVIG